MVSGLMLVTHHAHAQAASAPAGKEDSAPSERAKREAENVFRWIMIHSDKPRKVREDKGDKPAAAPAPVANAPRPAPAARVAKVGEGAAEGAVAAPAPAAPQAARASAVSAAAAVPVSNVDNEAARMANSAAANTRGAPAPAAMPDISGPPSAAPVEADPEPLVMVTQVEPQFPRALMLDLRKGTVRVRFDVMPDGSVSAPTVVTTTNARLNRAALAAVAQWRFQPLHESQEGIVELGFNLD